MPQQVPAAVHSRDGYDEWWRLRVQRVLARPAFNHTSWIVTVAVTRAHGASTASALSSRDNAHTEPHIARKPPMNATAVAAVYCKDAMLTKGAVIRDSETYPTRPLAAPTA